MTFLIDNLWMLCMIVSVVFKGLPGIFPHAEHSLGAIGDITFSLACLFANPAGAMAALKGVTTTRWSTGPTEVKA